MGGVHVQFRRAVLGSDVATTSRPLSGGASWRAAAPTIKGSDVDENAGDVAVEHMLTNSSLKPNEYWPPLREFRDLCRDY